MVLCHHRPKTMSPTGHGWKLPKQWAEIWPFLYKLIILGIFYSVETWLTHWVTYKEWLCGSWIWRLCSKSMVPVSIRSLVRHVTRLFWWDRRNSLEIFLGRGFEQGIQGCFKEYSSASSLAPANNDCLNGSVCCCWKHLNTLICMDCLHTEIKHDLQNGCRSSEKRARQKKWELQQIIIK